MDFNSAVSGGVALLQGGGGGQGAWGGGGGGGGVGAIITGGAFDGETLSGTIEGGDGGNAGSGGGGGGGSGGNGDSGLVLRALSESNLTITGTITGGNGGSGVGSGAGGNGARGLAVEGNSGTVTLTVTGGGSISGGNAGIGGNGATVRTGGAGIEGANLAVILETGGSIGGGLNGDQTAHGNAITFTGGTNSLEIRGGSTSGIIDATAGTADKLILGGSGNLSFNTARIGDTALLRGFETLEKAGTGTWTLTGDASGFTGAVSVEEGTLALSGNTSLGTTSRVTVNATLNLEASTTNGSGIRNLSGAANGHIVLGNQTLTVQQDHSNTFAGVISGTGGLVKEGAGALILTGANTYTGLTIINAGTLQLGNGSTSGSIESNVEIGANGTLAFNRSDDYVFPGAISGEGTVAFLGGGTVRFANASGYTGPILVDGSFMHLETGSTSGSVIILRNGGILGGNGGVGGLVVNRGGIAAPGNSPGVLTVNGTVAFNDGGIYRVDVTPTLHHDLIIATGTVTIDPGAIVQVVAVPGVYQPNTTYTILQGASVSGTFGSVSSDYAFLIPSLSYDADEVFLTLVYNARYFSSLAATPNQIAAANATQALGGSNAVFNAIVQLPVSAVPSALNALSGEVYPSTSSLIQQQSVYVREAVGARLRQSVTAPGVQPLPYAAKAAGPTTASLGADLTPTLWAQGYGGWGNTFSNGNAATISNSIGGFLIGADVAVLPNARAGIFGGFSQSQFDMDARSSSGSMDNYDLGLYGAAQFGGLALRGGLSYTWHDVSVDRTVSFPGFSQALSAGYSVGTTQVFGELGYDVAVGAYAFEPFVGLAYVATNGASFSESGGSAGLAVDIAGFNTFYTTLGVRAATTIQVMGHTLTPNATVGWQHAFGDTDPTANMLFQGGATPFQISGVPIAEDALMLGRGSPTPSPTWRPCR